MVKVESYNGKKSNSAIAVSSGHASPNCSLTFKCVRVRESHVSNNFASRNTLPKCANCSSLLPANHRGCTKNSRKIKSPPYAELEENVSNNAFVDAPIPYISAWNKPLNF